MEIAVYFTILVIIAMIVDLLLEVTALAVIFTFALAILLV